MTLKLLFAVVNVSLVIVYAFGSGLWVSTGGAFYRSLVRPFWQPPDWVFGIAWPYNFAVLIAAGVAVGVLASTPQRLWWTGLFALSVVAALFWARLFYASQDLPAAAIALGLAAVLTVPLVVIAWQARPWAGLVLVPYQAWLVVATFLSAGYWALNRG
jgi:tryptophan-rich sensory protein